MVDGEVLVFAIVRLCEGDYISSDLELELVFGVVVSSQMSICVSCGQDANVAGSGIFASRLDDL
jgi:hypothetical protein